MNLPVKRLAAFGAVAAAAVLVPAAGASAAPLPLVVPHLPAFSLPAGGLAGALPGGWAGGTLGFRGPQVAIGPTVIGSVFNGGTSVVVANDPPVNSGNVIGSP